MGGGFNSRTPSGRAFAHPFRIAALAGRAATPSDEVPDELEKGKPRCSPALAHRDRHLPRPGEPLEELHDAAGARRRRCLDVMPAGPAAVRSRRLATHVAGWLAVAAAAIGLLASRRPDALI